MMSLREKEVNFVKILFVCLKPEMHFSYSQQKASILKAMLSNAYCSKIGQIWQTLEKGVNYPVIHYLPLKETNNDIEMNGIIGEEFTSFQVLYEELERIRMPVIVPDFSASLTRQRTVPSNCAQIFIGFKTLDKTFNIVLEENWKDWTGARQLYLSDTLSSDFGLSEICFFRRIVPNDLNAFMYILIAHCTHINDKNRIFLLDFVDRFRLQRLCGYLTVYTNISNDSICSHSSLTSMSSDSGNSSADSRNLIQQNIEQNQLTTGLTQMDI